jgi:hypothetical protein
MRGTQGGPAEQLPCESGETVLLVGWRESGLLDGTQGVSVEGFGGFRRH